MSTTFSVATNFDDGLPARLAGHGATELFGKLRIDCTGGGRASYMLTPVSRHSLEKHVKSCRASGLGFDYLLNPACLGNREFTARFQRDLNRMLDWLSEMGIEWLTVSLPLILEIVKKRYPNFRVKVGVYAQVNSPARARFWQELGADCISIDPLTANRDFKRLRAIRESVSCELQLLANATCLKECPLSPYHMVGLSHASQARGERFMVDYCLLKCTLAKLLEPANYLMSPWIRPEDLGVYEAMGYTAFKVLERDAPTDALVNRTQAYHQRRFEGNLIELIQPYGYRERRSGGQPKRGRWWDLREFVRPWKANPLAMLEWRDFARMSGMVYEAEGAAPVSIDNRALDGFLEGMIERDCGSRDCSECRYCHDVARDVVKIDPGYRLECVELARGLIGDMRAGDLWRHL